jgi:hypothetical protein
MENSLFGLSRTMSLDNIFLWTLLNRSFLTLSCLYNLKLHASDRAITHDAQ